MSYPTPHNHYFSPSGKFIGIRTLQKDFIEKSESFFSNTLWQTNTDNQLSFQKYSINFNKKAKIFFEEAMNKNHNSFDYRFSCELLSNYLINLDSFLTQKDSSIEPKYWIKSPLRYTKNQNFEKNFLVRLFLNPIRKDPKTLLSNKNKVDSLLDYLTEIFFIENKKYDGLEQIWILFLENLLLHKRKFEDEEKDITVFSTQHYETFISRAKPYNWGWYEIHIKCFTISYLDTLTECLTLKSKLITNSQELDTIYEFSKEILLKINIADKNENDSEGLLISSSYINLHELCRAIEFYENYKLEIIGINPESEQVLESELILEKKQNVFIISKKHESGHDGVIQALKTPILDNDLGIQQNTIKISNKSISQTDEDFIDYFVGKSRKEKEHFFNLVVEHFLIPSEYVIRNPYCTFGIYWKVEDKFTGKITTAFIETLIKKGWIFKRSGSPEVLINKFKHCFEISDEIPLNKTNFYKGKLNEIMEKRGQLFSDLLERSDAINIYK
jgi:hypothetical protein